MALGLIVLILVSVQAVAFKAEATNPLATSVPNMISVVAGTNGDLYWNGFFTDHWSGWQSLSGASPSPPGLCQSGHGRVELVVEGYGQSIFHKSFSAGSWSPTWDKVPTGATGDQPVCAVLGTTMHLVVRGTDDELWANSLDLNTGTWSAWVNLGGSSPSPPALAASPSINALDLVARGEDNKVYHTFYASGSWSTAWEWARPDCGTLVAPITNTSPAIVSGNSTGTSIVQVAFVAAINQNVYLLADFAGRSWNVNPTPCVGWQDIAGSLNPPSLMVDQSVPANSPGTVYALWNSGEGSVNLSSRTFDLNPGDKWDTGPLPGPYPAGGYTQNRPAGAVLRSGTIGVVVSGASKDLWYNSFTYCCAWSGWTTMTGATNIDPGLITVP